MKNKSTGHGIEEIAPTDQHQAVIDYTDAQWSSGLNEQAF